MDYAIIQSGKTEKLEVIKLTDWQSYEWDDFATLKESGTSNIKWFDEESEAIKFLKDNFRRDLIDSKYFPLTSIDGKYHID